MMCVLYQKCVSLCSACICESVRWVVFFVFSFDKVSAQIPACVYTPVLCRFDLSVHARALSV